jgi:glucose-6-phosphate-specific signal transduction histidine kinase
MSETSDRPADGINSDRYFIVLGTAAADLWSHLPQELQQSLFERAVFLGHKSEREESVRKQLAKFLHDHRADPARLSE